MQGWWSMTGSPGPAYSQLANASQGWHIREIEGISVALLKKKRNLHNNFSLQSVPRVTAIYIAGFFFPMERSAAGAACQVFVEQQSSAVR